MRKKPKKQHNHGDAHRWVISYADFITLLFAFFVVMYAISSVNVSKYKSLSDGMQSAFDSKGNKDTKESSEKQTPKNIIAGVQDEETKKLYFDGLDDLNKSLQDLEDSDYKIIRKDGYIELQIKAGSMFDSADAQLKPEAIIKLMKLSGKIDNAQFPVLVEGYTDNVPITSLQFPSNWELSAARAATVGRVLNSYGVQSERLSVTGYGDLYPIFDNVTEIGRSQNRRVSIVIVKDRNSTRILNPEMGQVQPTLNNDIKEAEAKKAQKTNKNKGEKND